MLRFFIPVIGGLITLSSQTYIPPPPPQLPEALSESAVRKGEWLFRKNVWHDGKIETYNYLGSGSCTKCHDHQNALNPEHLAKNYKELPNLINRQIVEKLGGSALPLESPQMDALVQYMTLRYKLFEHKIPKSFK